MSRTLSSPYGHAPDENLESCERRSRSTRPILGVIVATAVFYAAKDLLLPMAMAAMLAVIFSPIASRLEKFIGRAFSAALVVLLTISVLAAIGYFLSVELASVAVQVAGYSDNVAVKISTVEKSTPQWLHRVEEGVANVQHQLRWKIPRPAAAQQPASQLPNTQDIVKQALPIATDVGEGALVIVLLFFLLIVLPQFANVFQDFNAKLDPVLVTFLGISNFLRSDMSTVLIVLTCVLSIGLLLSRRWRLSIRWSKLYVIQNSRCRPQVYCSIAPGENRCNQFTQMARPYICI